jgi:hypothetical protein
MPGAPRRMPSIAEELTRTEEPTTRSKLGFELL